MTGKKLLAVCCLCLVCNSPSAVVVQIRFTDPFVFIQIGHGQFNSRGLFGPPEGLIDEVNFSFPVGVVPGDGTAITGTPVIPMMVLGYSGANQANYRVTMNSATPLLNGNGDSLQFSEFSWTTRDGDISPGRFNDSPSQLLQQYNFNWRRGRGVVDYLTFTYDNDQIFPAGTYTGRVVYTITAL